MALVGCGVADGQMELGSLWGEITGSVRIVGMYRSMRMGFGYPTERGKLFRWRCDEEQWRGVVGAQIPHWLGNFIGISATAFCRGGLFRATSPTQRPAEQKGRRILVGTFSALNLK